MNHKKNQKASLNGWLNIDKPVGVTSTFITNKLKRILNPTKIGHAGTLDPAASGILPIALGEATKTIEYMMDAKKAYIFTIKFGETTDTLDREGKIIQSGGRLPTLDEIQKVIPQFIGKIKQVPPVYSAIKIDGVRAYDLARMGEVVEMKEREVEIFRLDVKGNGLENDDNPSPNLSEITLECECSKGTYIRTLGADIAKAVQTIGYITYLRRIMVGSFTQDSALNIENLIANTNEGLLLDEKQIISHLKPIDVVLDDIPVLHLDAEICKRLRDGQRVPTQNDEGIFKVYNNKKIFAMVSVESGLLKTIKVFNL